MAEKPQVCPACASTNIAFSRHENALVCRDCGTISLGKAVAEQPEQGPIEREIAPKLKIEEKIVKPAAEKKTVKKVKKPAKKVKLKKIKKAKIKIHKKMIKSKKKSLLRRLLKRK